MVGVGERRVYMVGFSIFFFFKRETKKKKREKMTEVGRPISQEALSTRLEQCGLIL